MQLLKDKVSIITGGCSGMGKAGVELFSKAEFWMLIIFSSLSTQQLILQFFVSIFGINFLNYLL